MLKLSSRVRVLLALTSMLLMLPVQFTSAHAVASTCAQGGSCVIGDRGPGGGIVYYVDNSIGGFNCGPTFSSNCHYLETAPSGWNGSSNDPKTTWSLNAYKDIFIPENPYHDTGFNDSSTIGLGYEFSIGIVNQGNDTSTAAGLARSYSGGSQTDWYLPTTSELNLLCQWDRGQIQDVRTPCSTAGAINSGIGASGAGFQGDQDPFYWTSSQGGPGAFLQYFPGGDQSTWYKYYPNRPFYVRPIRAFSSGPTITSGQAPNSQVATIPSGLTSATIPATASLPRTTLNFATTNGTESITVAPISNPAGTSATPFTVTGSTKFVDIYFSGSSGGVTVCIEGAPTDHLYHYTGGAWVELPSLTYVNGQVCGVTASFSPFAVAEPAPAALVMVSASIPDPVQQSKLETLTAASFTAGSSAEIKLSGTFIEKVSNIYIDGTRLAGGSWTQTPTSLAFTIPTSLAGSYQIQIFNGSIPVLPAQYFTVAGPALVSTQISAAPVKKKITYIHCTKAGRGTRIAYGINPVCPLGFVKK